MKNIFKQNLYYLCIITFISTCNSARSSSPAIELTEIPKYEVEGSLKGLVSDVEIAEFSVAVYIFVSGWWSKPAADTPLTTIRSDGTWECEVSASEGDRRATRYAAFLVPSGYAPPVCRGAPKLPANLYSKSAAHVARSRPAGREILFSGYRWWIKETHDTKAGPGPNWFSGSKDNVWLDDQGRLHLKITKAENKWQCAEIVSMDHFGYGTYRVYLDTPPQVLDPNAVLGLFTWSDTPDFTHREIDVEISKWSDPGDSDNAQFVVQPWTTSGNRRRFEIPEDQAETTHCFKWSPKRIQFVSYKNHYLDARSGNKKCSSWSYSGSDRPPAGDENFRMNLWLNEGLSPSNGEEIEAVISRFEFIPLKQSPQNRVPRK